MEGLENVTKEKPYELKKNARKSLLVAPIVRVKLKILKIEMKIFFFSILK